MVELKELFELTKNFILNLSNKTCLYSFYIGKAKDVDAREYQHLDDGYGKSIEIAHSSSLDKINEAEKYLISKFEEETDFPVTFDNKRGGGGGNPDADKLYVALHYKPKSIDELDDDEIEFESIEI